MTINQSPKLKWRYLKSDKDIPVRHRAFVDGTMFVNIIRGKDIWGIYYEAHLHGPFETKCIYMRNYESVLSEVKQVCEDYMAVFNPNKAEREMAIKYGEIKPCLHFVGFRDDRYWNAVKVFGEPQMIHHDWDRRAEADVAPEDLVIFGNDKDYNRYLNGEYCPYSFMEDF